MGCAKRVNYPVFAVLVSDQSTDAHDRVVDVLRELVAHRSADIVVALAVMAISLGESFEIRYRFDVPNDDACAHVGSLLTAVCEFMPI